MLFGGERGAVWVGMGVLPPLPVCLGLTFMRLARSLVFLWPESPFLKLGCGL